MRTRIKTGAAIFGTGKAKTRIIIESPSAGIQFKSDQEIRFLAETVDNAADSISIIHVFRFEAKKRRLAATLGKCVR